MAVSLLRIHLLLRNGGCDAKGRSIRTLKVGRPDEKKERGGEGGG